MGNVENATSDRFPNTFVGKLFDLAFSAADKKNINATNIRGGLEDRDYSEEWLIFIVRM